MPAPATQNILFDVDDTDQDMMRKNGFSIYIEGVMKNPSGQSCNPQDPAACRAAPTIRFRWGLAAATRFADCQGFRVSADTNTDVALTLDMDHWFRTTFTLAAESGPRRAQWVADADVDGDGETTLVELRAIAATDLLRPGLGYDLAGAPSTVKSVEDFLVAQARTLGINSATGCRQTIMLD